MLRSIMVPSALLGGLRGADVDRECQNAMKFEHHVLEIHGFGA